MNSNVLPYPNYWALVPAAGIGSRMQAQTQTDLSTNTSHIPKQYLVLHGKTILEHTLDCLAAYTPIGGIIVALNQQDDIWPTLNLPYQNKLITTIGGESRAHSVLNGLLALKPLAGDNDWVLVHDAVRPCLRHEDIDKLMQMLRDHPVGGILATRVRDTLKRIDAENGNMLLTVERTDVWQALTPQMFRYSKLLHALQNVVENNLSITDEAAAIEFLGLTSLIVEGRRDNIKITYPEDLQWVSLYLQNFSRP